MRNKILILGKGFIGQRLQEAWGCTISAKKISRYQDVLGEIKKYKPRILVNCIGHTGKRNVDDCEQALDKTLVANTYIPVLLAEAALRNHLKFIHISSGCIYHYDYAHQSPIREDTMPDYYHLYYGRSKIYAENILRELARYYPILIPRIRIPLDSRPHPKNLLTKLLQYKRIIDLPNSVTYIPDFIRALEHLIRKDARGIYNIVCKGTLRYPQLLEHYRKYRPQAAYQIVPFQRLKMMRPPLVLSTRKLEKTGFQLRSIREVIPECVREYLQYL